MSSPPPPPPPPSCRKTLIRTMFLSQIRRSLARVLSRAKSFLVEAFPRRSSSSVTHFFIYLTSCRNSMRNDRMFFGSFRLHYNMCSSRYWSAPTSSIKDSLPASATTSQASYNDTSSTWRYDDAGNGIYNHPEPAGLSGYLCWLEEENVREGVKDDEGDQAEGNEIDRLADVFIANCHEKFILEKQESDRRFQEMLARSM